MRQVLRMKGKPLNKAEEATYRKYHIPGCENFQRRAKNTVCFSAINTVRHEIAKAIGGLMLQKWGDIKFTPEINEALEKLAKATEHSFRGWPKQKKAFITEVVPNDNRERRVDLVRLEDNTRYEFVLSSCPPGAKEEGCIIIKL